MIMKKIILLSAFSLIAIASNVNAQVADDKYLTIPCEHPEIHKQLVELNTLKLNGQAKLSMFQVIQVPTKAYVPVLVNVEKGKRYMVNISADKSYRNLEMSMIDGDKNELFRVTAKGKKGENAYLTKEFEAKETGQYWLILHQSIKKGSSECLGVGIIALN